MAKGGFLTDAQWDHLKKAVKGEEQVYKYEKPVYVHSRLSWIVKRSDGEEHVFGRSEEDEAWDFYNEISGDGRQNNVITGKEKTNE